MNEHIYSACGWHQKKKNIEQKYRIILFICSDVCVSQAGGRTGDECMRYPTHTYLKSISSTFIELISTTNMLNFTTTGVPFFDGGRTSATMGDHVRQIYGKRKREDKNSQ